MLQKLHHTNEQAKPVLRDIQDDALSDPSSIGIENDARQKNLFEKGYGPSFRWDVCNQNVIRIK